MRVLGNSIDVRELRQKAYAPIDFKPSGRLIVVKAASGNASSPIVSSLLLSEISTLARVEVLNAIFPIYVTASGILIVVNGQSENA